VNPTTTHKPHGAERSYPCMHDPANCQLYTCVRTVLACSRPKTTLNQLYSNDGYKGVVTYFVVFRSKAAARAGPLLWTSNPVQGAPRQGRLQRGLPGIGHSCKVRKSALFPERDLQVFGGQDVRLIIPSCKIWHQVAWPGAVHSMSPFRSQFNLRPRRERGGDECLRP
jgi:hypothetical protein